MSLGYRKHQKLIPNAGSYETFRARDVFSGQESCRKVSSRAAAALRLACFLPSAARENGPEDPVAWTDLRIDSYFKSHVNSEPTRLSSSCNSTLVFLQYKFNNPTAFPTALVTFCKTSRAFRSRDCCAAKSVLALLVAQSGLKFCTILRQFQISSPNSELVLHRNMRRSLARIKSFETNFTKRRVKCIFHLAPWGRSPQFLCPPGTQHIIVNTFGGGQTLLWEENGLCRK